MPILKPSTPPKRINKPVEKTLSSKKGNPARGTSALKSKGQVIYSSPPAREPSWWEKLSAERKLDVVGVILAFLGGIILLGLLFANRSALIGGAVFFLYQILGWGVYGLPLGLLVFGLWLVLRKIGSIPRIYL